MAKRHWAAMEADVRAGVARVLEAATTRVLGHPAGGVLTVQARGEGLLLQCGAVGIEVPAARWGELVAAGERCLAAARRQRGGESSEGMP